MKIVFTANGSPLSRAIRGITGEPVSHVIIVQDDTVFQSNLFGVGMETLAKFTSGGSALVYSLDFPDDYPRLIQSMGRLNRSTYDFLALVYVGLALILKHYLKIPLPKRNPWSISGAYMCTEFVTATLGAEDTMVTPYQLYLQLKAKLGQ